MTSRLELRTCPDCRWITLLGDRALKDHLASEHDLLAVAEDGCECRYVGGMEEIAVCGQCLGRSQS